MLERTQYRRRNAGRSALLLCVAIASAGLPLCRAECEDDTDCGSEKAVINRDGSYVYTAENLVVARGYCRDARCICTAPYTGANCEKLNEVAGPQVPDTLRVNSWRFLAKSCWAGETTGSLRIKMEWKNLECNDDGICFPVDTPTWNSANTPSVYFYASFDPAFEEAVLASYKGIVEGEQIGSEHCSGADSVLSRSFTCRKKSEDDAQTCVYEDTFRVVNRAQQGTLVYVVVGGCGLKGVVDWSVEVTVDDASRDDERGSVCGATLTTLQHRCFSEAGGSCEVQNADLISYDFTPKQELARSAIAAIAVSFVVVVILGLIAIKMWQARHKKARAQRMLGRMGIVGNKNTGEGEEGDAYAGTGNTQQQFTISGVQSN